MLPKTLSQIYIFLNISFQYDFQSHNTLQRVFIRFVRLKIGDFSVVANRFVKMFVVLY
jgi:hypothetical protein